MEPASRARPHDPDLDRPAEQGPVRLEPYFQVYQRLIANPFLALAALLLWLEGVRTAYRTKSLGLLLTLILLLFAIACLLQFHCLDCGATGMLFRWKRHSCPRAIARQLAGRPRRFRGPNPTVQTVLWFYATLAIAGLYALVINARG